MATHWKGMDRQLPTSQKLRQVERAIDRLQKAQTRGDSKYLRTLRMHAETLRGQEKRQRKGLHLTKQAYA